MKRFLRKVRDVYSPFKKPMGTVLLFIVAMQAMGIAAPFLFGKIIDGIVAKIPFTDVLVLAILFFEVFIVHKVIVHYYKDKFEIERIDFDMPRHVANTTLEKVFGLSIGQHNNQNSGIKQSIINRGEHSLRTLGFMTVFQIFPLAAESLITTAAILYFNTLIGLILMSAQIAFVAVTIRINNHFREDVKKLQDISHKNSKVYSEFLKNIELVLANSQEEKGIREYDLRLAKHSDTGKDIWTRYVMAAVARGVIIGATLFLVLVIGAYQVYQGNYTAGYLVMFLSLSTNLMGHLWNVGNLHRQLLDLYSAVDKYFTMMDIEPEIKVVQNPVPVKNLAGRIEFRHVSFAYPMRKYFEDEDEHDITKAMEKSEKSANGALFDVNFVIEPGQKVAFVGHSGAGKSTITYLILRAYDPDKGQVIIDGNDLRLLDLKKYRRQIGTVEQHVGLFDNTLRYNIAFGLHNGHRNPSDAQLAEVGRSACIDQFYHRLEKGFETIIGERGIRLSGGERQRVGIARALIKDPRVLIFDEATSSLDSQNETLIHEAINNASRGKTTIIIAHRLSTVKDVDMIFVLEKGRIVGQGTHQELLDSCGAYQRLVSNQVISL